MEADCPPEDLDAFRALSRRPAGAGRPRYGLLGVKASWWSRLGGPARPFVVLLAGGRLALSKRSFPHAPGVTRHGTRSADLKAVKVRRGPLLESIRLTFADGYSLAGGRPAPWAEPAPRAPSWPETAEALEPARLSPEQLTNFCQAMAALGLWPAPRRGTVRPAPQS